MKEAKFIYFNGAFVEWDRANIHIMAHVIQYGSGVFEGIRAYETKFGTAIFRAYDHYKRLKESMMMYRMETKETIEDYIRITKDLLIKNQLKSAYIRPVVYRGLGPISPNPLHAPVETVIAAFEMPNLFDGKVEKGINVCVSSYRRFAPDTIPPLAKATGNYLNSQLAMMEAELNGFDEAVMLDVNGNIAEGPGENIFLVKDGVLYTPSITSSILKGITRDSIIKIAGLLNIPVYEQDLPREMLYAADEVFFCGTAAEITPIVSVDKIKVGDGSVGKITRMLIDKFREIVYEGKDPFNFLEFVETEGY
uniref:Branched-chain-amino-acid aminotransferase n=1 Tax=Caldisericum exile TaxID=693075 RepID=A0A7C4U3L0_9BACT